MKKNVYCQQSKLQKNTKLNHVLHILQGTTTFYFIETQVTPGLFCLDVTNLYSNKEIKVIK